MFCLYSSLLLTTDNINGKNAKPDVLISLDDYKLYNGDCQLAVQALIVSLNALYRIFENAVTYFSFMVYLN